MKVALNIRTPNRARCILLALATLAAATVAEAVPVNQGAVQRFSTSQMFTSNVPVLMQFERAGQAFAAGQGPDGSLVVGRFSAAGEAIWTASYAATPFPNERPVAMAADAAGHLFVLAVSRLGTDDFVTLRFDGGPQAAWTNRIDGPGAGDDNPTALALDEAGHVYVTGNTYVSTTVLIQGTVYTYAITTASYSADGAFRWRRDYQPTANYRQSHAIVADRRGRVFVSGMSVFFPDPRAPADQFVVLAYQAESGEWSEIYSADPANGFAREQTTLALGPKDNLVFAGYRSMIFQPKIRVTQFQLDLAPAWSAERVLPGGALSPSARPLAGLVAHPNGEVSVVAAFVSGDTAGGVDFQENRFDRAGAQRWALRYDGPASRDDWPTVVLGDDWGRSYVAGISADANGLDHWVTVCHQPEGTRAWAAPFGEFTTTAFRPLAMRVDEQGRVFVGGSVPGLAGAGPDLVVVKYVPHGASIALRADQLELRFVSWPGVAHRLQAADELSEWRDLARLVSDEDGAMEYSVPWNSAARQEFFRVVTP